MNLAGGSKNFYERILAAVRPVREKRDEDGTAPPIVYRRPFLINAFHSVIPTEWNAGLIEKGSHPNGQLSDHERALADETGGDRGVFVGIAGFKSLDMLSLIGSETRSGTSQKPRSRRYTRAILCDINTRQAEAMRKALAAIREYENPNDFIKHFASSYPDLMRAPTADDPRGPQYQNRLTQEEKDQYYNAYGNSYTPPPNADSLRQWCFKEQKENPYSWLKEENYKYIRALVKNNRIAALTADLRDKQVMDAIRDQLDKEELRVGHCYVSSVMDFMDPYVKTGYYSGDESLAGIKQFYENLLHLGDNARFIASVSSPAEVSPILHNYHLERMSRGEVEKKYRDLPATEPENAEKTCSILFNTGDQVWRLAEFEAPNGSHYFRIFSETKPHDMVKLSGQIDTINNIVQSLQDMKNRRHIASANFVEEESIANNPEAKFFAQQAQEPLDNRHMLSCKPFTLQAERGQDVYDTIEALVGSIKEALQRKNVRDTAWRPNVVVTIGGKLPVSKSPVVPPGPPPKKPQGPGLFG